MRALVLTLLLTALTVAAARRPPPRNQPKLHTSVPTDEWAVHLEQPHRAKAVARASGLELVGPIANLKDYFLFRYPRATAARGIQDSDIEHVERTLEDHPEIRWYERQIRRQTAVPKAGLPTDPAFPDQWHLVSRNGTIDSNATGSWNMGYTGKGVVICIVDDGLEHNHTDFADKYRPELSKNLNDGPPEDPSPGGPFDFHGTSCAGVALAAANNSVCGVGMAYDAEVAAVRSISGIITAAEEAGIFSWMSDDIHVYSNSWGPSDDGFTLGRTPRLVEEVWKNQVEVGRQGLGSIYVWAGGNGLASADSCNKDQYAASPYTIAVGAVNDAGVQSPYSESCPSLVVVAPSDGGANDLGITTSDLGFFGGCQGFFGGTSSATPLVSGVIANMLEARPYLGWRDVMAILMHTATKTDPTDEGWKVNGAGFNINHKYGFGLVNGGLAVELALTWEKMAPFILTSDYAAIVEAVIPDVQPLISTVTVADPGAVYQVQVTANLTHDYGHDLSIILTSPSGTQSILGELHGFAIASNASFVSPASLTGTVLNVTEASYGPAIVPQFEAELIVPENITGCDFHNVDMTGKVALIQRGDCFFTDKTYFAELAGALGVIIYNNRPGSFVPFGSDEFAQIPTWGMSDTLGLEILNEIQNNSATVVVSLGTFESRPPAAWTYNDYTFTSFFNWGEEGAGDWQLEIADLAPGPGTSGYLSNWTLTLFRDAPPEPSSSSQSSSSATVVTSGTSQSSESVRIVASLIMLAAAVFLTLSQ